MKDILHSEIFYRQAKIEYFERQIQDLTYQRSELVSKLDKYSTIYKQIKMLASSINKKVNTRIDLLNRPAKVKIIPLKSSKVTDLEILAYDKKTFTHKRIFGSYARHLFILIVKLAYLTLYKINKLIFRLMLRIVKRIRYRNG